MCRLVIDVVQHSHQKDHIIGRSIPEILAQIFTDKSSKGVSAIF